MCSQEGPLISRVAYLCPTNLDQITATDHDMNREFKHQYIHPLAFCSKSYGCPILTNSKLKPSVGDLYLSGQK